MISAFTKESDIFEFFKHLNTIHPNIQFTYELAQNKKLAFLDVWINNEDGELKLNTYRKPTNTGLYIKWQSFVPLKYKINLIRNLLHRAYKICNSYSLIHQDFQTISSMLKRNGYPTWFIDTQIKRFFNTTRSQPRSGEKSQITKDKSLFSILRLPYIGDTSHQIEKEIKKFLNKKLS